MWGAGAIGGTLGAYFSRAGHDITFVDIEPEHVEAINARGLHLSGPIDDFRVHAPAFLPEDLTGRWHCTLLCTKAQHTDEATHALLAHLADDGYVVSAQNGLNEHIIARLVGKARTVGCFVNFGADYYEPGEIHFGGRGAVVLGELDGALSKRLQTLHELFLTFEPNAITTTNIWGYLWSKLAYGALLFATALSDASIAEALAASRYHPLYIELVREVLAVAQAEGAKPEPFNGFAPQSFAAEASDRDAQRSLMDMVEFNRKSTKTHSGIWRDLAVRKRHTEADAQLGAIVAIGANNGLATPLTTRLISLVHDIEQGQRKQGWNALDALRICLTRPMVVEQEEV